MALLLKNGSIFLHIPKTGGNWVEDVLKKNDLVERRIAHKHADVDRCLCEYFKVKRSERKGFFWRSRRHHISNPFMFCFVRHPLSWYESWFKYMSQPNRRWQYWGDETDIFDWHPNAILNGLGDADFNQFVRNVVRKRPGYVTELYGWYTKPQINFIGKQENLAGDLIKALKLMDVNFDEKSIVRHEKVGVSSELSEEIKWEEELRREVLKLEYVALCRYGYSTREG